eukprot:NODE_4837_length_445_cov_239.560606_g4180_i0.p3 GENE.NODE_4837_length_445_cov_239.560606_g4180_i0~~NODE_4837_length_445_cov_239.560606_g4180_i0.p3  ORF type:complete len:70 (+),score=15.42 NODE_4837_length_445_cov_239.560606_g4180_i0:67-276(+)
MAGKKPSKKGGKKGGKKFNKCTAKQPGARWAPSLLKLPKTWPNSLSVWDRHPKDYDVKPRGWCKHFEDW